MKDVNIPDSAKEAAIKGIVDSGRSIDSYKSGYDVEPISEYERLVKARNAKGISLEEWGWLISANQGNEENAKNDLYTKSTSDIRKMIAADKDRDEDDRYGWQKAQGQGDIYAERTQKEWDEYTDGNYSIPDLTKYDEFEVFEYSNDISDNVVFLAKTIPGFVFGEGLGILANGASQYYLKKPLSPQMVHAVNTTSALIGAFIGYKADGSMLSAGEEKTFAIYAKDGINKKIYTVRKYDTGGIDVVTTEFFLGNDYPIVTKESFPYDSFSEE